MFAFASSPYIITTWTSSPIASSILSGPGWRWGFGIFCIVTPAVTTPLLALFMVNLRKARARGLIPAEKAKSGRTTLESIKYYFVEFDAIGLLLVSAGLSLFLLSFSLYSLQPNQWRSPLVISFIVIGGLLMAAFVVWEKWFAPVKFLPYHLLTDRTVLGACVLSAVLFVSFYIWDSYFLSFLQVVNGLSVTHAGYVFNTYSIGSCLWALVVGVVIRWTGRFKPLALYFGMPLTILGVALMIHFRQPDVNIGYIVMCQIFIAFAGGTLVICEQTAAMAAVSHQYVAVVLALEGMFAYVGGAIGQTVASAIWTGVFPKKLEQYLPESAQQNLTQIYGSLVVQLSYPRGTPERDAIILAYGDAQRNMLIASSAVLVIGVVAVFFWRDINVKERKQVKGLVI